MATKPLSKSAVFTVEGICSIIKAAHHHDVQELTLGELRVVFNSRLPYGQLDKPRSHSPVLDDPTVQAVFPEEFTPSQVAGDKELTEEMRISQLLVSDPMGFESEMIDEHIHGRRTEPDETAQDLGS